MPIAFLLSLQAAGMVVDWLNTNQQAKLAQSGNDLTQAGITADIATSRLQTADQSLQAMTKLRMNLGSQMAMQAARGVRSSGINSVLQSNESVGNFNADERMRKINQMGTENALKAKGLISNLDSQANTNDRWNAFAQRTVNKFPTSPQAYGKIAEGFSSKNNYGFGMSKVGT